MLYCHEDRNNVHVHYLEYITFCYIQSNIPKYALTLAKGDNRLLI